MRSTAVPSIRSGAQGGRSVMMKEFLGNSYLFGGNAPFIEELYEAYLENPESVDAGMAALFRPDAAAAGRRATWRMRRSSNPSSGWRRSQRGNGHAHAPTQAVATVEKKQVSVLQLINAYRFLGVRHANVDPLKRFEKPDVPELDPAYYGLTEADMDLVFNTGSLVGPRADAAARDPARAAGNLLRHHRRRVHVHDRYRAEALDPGAPRGHPLAAQLRRRLQAPHPRAADRRRNAGEIPAHALRRPEALLAGRRRKPDSAARHPAAARRRPRACRKS